MIAGEKLYTESGYAYLAKCGGEVYNSLDNPEKFETDALEQLPQKPNSSEYSRVDVGTAFKELTLTEAYTKYFPYIDQNRETYIVAQTTAAFDGEITLKGYINVYSSYVGGIDEGEAVFFPADGEWKDMPYALGCWGGFWGNEDVSFAFNAPTFSLGYADEYDIDLSALKKDEAVLVEVTLREIVLCGGTLDFDFAKNTAKIVDVKAIVNN